MTIDELKRKVETYRERLKSRTTASVAIADEKGPVGIAIIDDLVAAIESQQRQIDDLKQKVTRGATFG